MSKNARFIKFDPSSKPGKVNIPIAKVEDEEQDIPDTDTSADGNKDRGSGKKQSRACIRCRFRHTRCPGGQPCSKCQLAKTKCEYVEYDKRLVVSQKYLYKLQDDIARLKKENASLRSSLREAKAKESPSLVDGGVAPVISRPNFLKDLPQENQDPEDVTEESNEVIHPTLDKYGRLIRSRTGEKVYVGSSSMTLFGLEIQNMAPNFSTNLLHPNSSVSSPAESPRATFSTSGHSEFSDTKRETRILEKEGNAYNITLAKTNTRPGLSVNFTLPSYSYAILLVDTFINYNDGCFYFFNEGLVKRFLMNLYSGNAAENKKIIRRNYHPNDITDDEENPIKKDKDDNTILETIWFCKILLIFAIGEMYLGTESITHMKNSKEENILNYGNKARRNHLGRKNTLPGSGFFYQASELFTGLFASGAIDNITKDGGVEVMLLYAFYLQVADCTIASYFYFGLALRSTLILGWHVDADMENINRFELEHRRRIWWTVYMYERMLSSKAGLPLSFTDDSVSTELPFDFKISLKDFPSHENDVRGYYIFPSAEYINNCVTITQINAIILSSLYTKQPTANILPVVSDLVQRLFRWRGALPEFLEVDFSKEDIHISRLIVNLMTEYFQGMNLAVRPLLFHFATKKLKELHVSKSCGFIDLSKYSKNVLSLLNASFQASINTIKCIWALVPQNMVALFGWMDREYLFTSASTLILFNASFGVHEATREHLDHALTIFTRMKKLGNYPAALRRAQLLKLIRVLDFSGVMSELLLKHDDESRTQDTQTANMDIDKLSDSLNSSGAPNLNFVQPQPSHPHDIAHVAEPLHSGLDYLQFNGPVPSTTRPSSNRHTPTIPSSTNLSAETAFQFLPGISARGSGDIYANPDLAGIEGLTYLDEEQKLWSEITNDAQWLQPGDVPGVHYKGLSSSSLGGTRTALAGDHGEEGYDGAYSELISAEFQGGDYQDM